MKLDEFEIGQQDAASGSGSEPRAADVAGFVVRSKQAPIPPVASTTWATGRSVGSRSGSASRTPAVRSSDSHEVDETKRLQDANARTFENRRAQAAHDCGTGAVAARVNNSISAVTGFSAERQGSGRTAGRMRRRSLRASRCDRRPIRQRALRSPAAQFLLRPAVVSAACRSGESPAAIAAATPPWA